MFKVSTASVQTFIDTPNCVLEVRVQYRAVHIPNEFWNGHLHIIVWGLFENTDPGAQRLFDHPVQLVLLKYSVKAQFTLEQVVKVQGILLYSFFNLCIFAFFFLVL